MAQVVEHILGKDEVTGSSPVSSSNKKVSFVFLTKGTFLSDAFLAERDAALPVMHAFGECQNASHHPSQRSVITYHFLQRDYFVILFEKVPDV